MPPPGSGGEVPPPGSQGEPLPPGAGDGQPPSGQGCQEVSTGSTAASSIVEEGTSNRVFNVGQKIAGVIFGVLLLINAGHEAQEGGKVEGDKDTVIAADPALTFDEGDAEMKIEIGPATVPPPSFLPPPIGPEQPGPGSIAILNPGPVIISPPLGCS